MSNRLGFKTARAPRERDETAQRDGSHRARRTIHAERDILAERDLAELEALLTRDLQRSSSPSIAAEDGDGEQSLHDSEPIRKEAPFARPRAAARQSEAPQSAPRVPHESKQPSSTEFRRGPAPEPRPAHKLASRLHLLDDPPPAAMLRADRRSSVTRALGFAATVFSLIALVAVSALLVLLAVGGEWTTSDVTGSTEVKRDASRIPSEAYTARAGGTVRAVETQDVSVQTPQPAQTLPAENAAVASASVEGRPSPGAFAARSVFSPPPAEQASPAGQGFAPVKSSAAPAAEGPAAPAQAAATEPVGNSAGPAPETRSTSVTSHVNLRASPDNNAAVVAVVPAKQNVEVVECTRWCKVVFDGRQGFIHRRFVSGAGG